MKRFALILLLVLLSPVRTQAGTSPVSLALVVGNNSADAPDISPLRYADDDAIRTAELLTAMGVEVTLRVSPDEDTRRLLGTAPQVPPTRGEVLAALDSLVSRVRRQGASDSVIYFVYSGHGSYDPEGLGYLHLEDGRLTTRDMFHHLIVPTRGLCRVVIILDSCNAGFLLRSRGDAPRRVAGPTTLRLEDYDHVGLVLSVSSTGEVREWGRYLAGIFSHQLRSGLLGGADLNQDSRITFQELAAFLAAANQDVDNPNYRLTPYVRPPLGDREMVLLTLKPGPDQAYLRLDEPGRYTIHGASMLRYADLNVEQGFQARLILLGPGPFTVEQGERISNLVPIPGKEIAVSSLAGTAGETLEARNVDQYLAGHLFSTAFGREYSSSYLAERYEAGLAFVRTETLPWYENPWAWSLAGLGAAALGTGLYFHLDARSANDSLDQAVFGNEIERLNTRIERDNLATGILWGFGAAAGIGATLLFIFDAPETTFTVHPFRQEVRIQPAPGGAFLTATF